MLVMLALVSATFGRLVQDKCRSPEFELQDTPIHMQTRMQVVINFIAPAVARFLPRRESI